MFASFFVTFTVILTKRMPKSLFCTLRNGVNTLWKRTQSLSSTSTRQPVLVYLHSCFQQFVPDIPSQWHTRNVIVEASYDWCSLSAVSPSQWWWAQYSIWTSMEIKKKLKTRITVCPLCPQQSKSQVSYFLNPRTIKVIITPIKTVLCHCWFLQVHIHDKIIMSS